MIKQYKILLTFVILGLSAIVVKAQTTYLDESLTTQPSYNTFTAVSIKGEQEWYFGGINYGACMSGFFDDSSHENEDWFISSAIDLQDANHCKLTFDHTRGPLHVFNVGVAQGWYKVYATANYTGNVATTTWIEITGINHSIPAVWTFISSGELAIPEAAKSAHTRIAFKYLCDNTESATWEVKNVKVVGEPVLPDENTFKITTWNVEWLSCSTYEPTDVELQMNNVVSVIKTVNPDCIALQEVGTSAQYATIDTLVKRLGSANWGGTILPAKADNCFQNQAIIYKKSKVQFVGQKSLDNGAAYNGSSYFSNWSGVTGQYASPARYPVAYEVNLMIEDEFVPVIFVNIHAKAMPDEVSYTKRLGASVGLKGILDDAPYNTKNIVIIGDFNDYLYGTMCTMQTESPYQNFISDVAHYQGLTAHLQQYNCKWNYYWENPAIDNIIISNELFDNYVLNSAIDEIDAILTIPDYGFTTSGHAPISALFKFSAVAPVITTTSLPDGKTGTAYSAQLEATGTMPVLWELISGNLPTGLTLYSGGTISGMPTATGTFNFTVQAMNSAGNPTKPLTIKIEKDVSVLENEMENIRVYPNPTTGELKIEIADQALNDVATVEIFDIYGKSLLSHHLITSSSNHHINISNLSAGIYFVKIFTKAGEVVRMVVKE